MAAVIRSSCFECSKVFYLKEGEVLLMPTMMPRKSPPIKPYMETWADWVYHVSNYCPDCRIFQPPPACIADLQRHMALARKEAEDEEDENVL